MPTLWSHCLHVCKWGSPGSLSVAKEYQTSTFVLLKTRHFSLTASNDVSGYVNNIILLNKMKINNNKADKFIVVSRWLLRWVPSTQRTRNKNKTSRHWPFVSLKSRAPQVNRMQPELTPIPWNVTAPLKFSEIWISSIGTSPQSLTTDTTRDTWW